VTAVAAGYLAAGLAVAGAPLCVRLALAAEPHPARAGDLAVAAGYALAATALWPLVAWQWGQPASWG